jgi:hypothetical protein
MSNKKQTAVEYLLDQLLNNKGMVVISTSTFYFNEDVVNRAKAMEKQQIIDAFEIGYENGACVNQGESIYHGHNYYKETYEH